MAAFYKPFAGYYSHVNLGGMWMLRSKNRNLIQNFLYIKFLDGN